MSELNTLYPFEANYFETARGLKVHYVDEGERDAPPVLMVPRQSDLVVLLASPHQGALPDPPHHRTRPHRLRPLGQAL